MTQQSSDQSYSFNPNEHLMQIKSGQTSKDYLPVQWRLVWFRSLCPQGTIETELVLLDLDCSSSKEGVRQCGLAVTPPFAAQLVCRGIASLA